MKPFRQTPWMKRAIRRRELAQDRIVDRHITDLDRFFDRLTRELLAEIERSRRAPHVALRNLDILMEKFYVDVVSEGLTIAKKEDPGRPAEKAAKLAWLPKARLPRNIRDIGQVLGNRKVFQGLMKRRGKLSDGLKKDYLGRLNVAFQTIVPAILSNVVSVEDAHQALQDCWGATRSRAKLIFRMESTRYFAETQLSYFEDHPRIIGFLYDTIRDGARTQICRTRHGLVYRVGSDKLRENTPPNHFGCRAHLVPLADTESNRKMLEDPRRDPEKVRVEPLPPNWRK